MILGVKDGHTSKRRVSFKEAAEHNFNSTALECWIASDASAILEHTKK